MLNEKHDCSKCPEKLKLKCTEENKKTYDEFMSIVDKVKDIITLSASSICTIKGDKGACLFFAMMEQYCKVHKELFFDNKWLYQEDIDTINEISVNEYFKEKELINMINLEVIGHDPKSAN